MRTGNAIGLIEGPNFTAYNGSGADIAQYSRLKITGAETNGCPTVGLAGVGDVCIGIAQVPIANGGFGNARFENASGSQIYLASEAIAAGDKIYSAAAGKVKKTSAAGVVSLGAAWTSTAADGDFIMAIRGEQAGLAANA